MSNFFDTKLQSLVNQLLLSSCGMCWNAPTTSWQESPSIRYGSRSHLYLCKAGMSMSLEPMDCRNQTAHAAVRSTSPYAGQPPQFSESYPIPQWQSRHRQHWQMPQWAQPMPSALFECFCSQMSVFLAGRYFLYDHIFKQSNYCNDLLFYDIIFFSLLSQLFSIV